MYLWHNWITVRFNMIASLWLAFNWMHSISNQFIVLRFTDYPRNLICSDSIKCTFHKLNIVFHFVIVFVCIRMDELQHSSWSDSSLGLCWAVGRRSPLWEGRKRFKCSSMHSASFHCSLPRIHRLKINQLELKCICFCVNSNRAILPHSPLPVPEIVNTQSGWIRVYNSNLETQPTADFSYINNFVVTNSSSSHLLLPGR